MLLEGGVELAIVDEHSEVVVQLLEACDGALVVLEGVVVGGGLEGALQCLIRARVVLQEYLLEVAEHSLLPVEHQLDVLLHQVVSLPGFIYTHHLRSCCLLILWLSGRGLHMRVCDERCTSLRSSGIMLEVVPALILRAIPPLAPQEILSSGDLLLTLGHLSSRGCIGLSGLWLNYMRC